MANTNCSACDDIRKTDPNLLINGFTDTECASLKNNTGLVPSSGHNDCTDLNNLNDCLVGNMKEEIDAYNNCDWKEFMKKFIPNVWTTLKGIICAICGLWTNVACLNKKVDLITFAPTVKAFRGGGVAEASVIYTDLEAGDDIGTLKVYMDATETDAANQSPNGTYGSQVADRDYIAFVTWCADGESLGGSQTSVQVSVRNNSQSEGYGTNRAQHYSVKGADHLSMNQTGFCYLPKGGHLLIRSHCSSAGSGAKFRVHQFSMVLMPLVNTDVSC